MLVNKNRSCIMFVTEEKINVPFWRHKFPTVNFRLWLAKHCCRILIFFAPSTKTFSHHCVTHSLTHSHSPSIPFSLVASFAWFYSKIKYPILSPFSSEAHEIRRRAEKLSPGGWKGKPRSSLTRNSPWFLSVEEFTQFSFPPVPSLVLLFPTPRSSFVFLPVTFWAQSM